MVCLVATDPEGPRPTSPGPTRADLRHPRELRIAGLVAQNLELDVKNSRYRWSRLEMSTPAGDVNFAISRR